jgi:hypothetical protein
MLTLVKSPLHRTLLILLVATVAAFWMRNDGLVGLSIGASTLAIAWFKGRLVVLDFMELRHAPLIWRALIEGWLLLVSACLFIGYWMGLNSAT